VQFSYRNPALSFGKAIVKMLNTVVNTKANAGPDLAAQEDSNRQRRILCYLATFPYCERFISLGQPNRSCPHQSRTILGHGCRNRMGFISNF
jgi:hypothetical protein